MKHHSRHPRLYHAYRIELEAAGSSTWTYKITRLSDNKSLKGGWKYYKHLDALEAAKERIVWWETRKTEEKTLVYEIHSGEFLDGL